MPRVNTFGSGELQECVRSPSRWRDVPPS
jgi:hypothetical protein